MVAGLIDSGKGIYVLMKDIMEGIMVCGIVVKMCGKKTEENGEGRCGVMWREQR